MIVFYRASYGFHDITYKLLHALLSFEPFIIGQTAKDWERWLKANKLLL